MSNQGQAVDPDFGARPADGGFKNAAIAAQAATPAPAPVLAAPAPAAPAANADPDFGAPPPGGGFRTGTPVQARGFVRSALDLGAAGWADYTRREDPGAGSSTPALDNYFQNTPAGQMLKHFGQDVTAPVSQLPALSTIDDGKGLDFLKSSGGYDAWLKNHAATSAYFRNSAMRPSAVDAMGLPGVSLPGTIGTLTSMMLTQPVQQMFLGPIGQAFNALRRDAMAMPDADDLDQLKGRPLLTQMLPYLHHYLTTVGDVPGTMPGTAKALAEAMDAVQLGASTSGIPQLIGQFAHETAVAAANIFKLPGETPEQKQLRIQKSEDELNFAAWLIAPEGAPMKARLNIYRRLDQAKRAGVIGKPPLFTSTGPDLKAAAKGEAEQAKAQGVVTPTVQRPAGMPDPDLQPSPAAAAEPATAPVEAQNRDVHAIAREMAPELFTQYDPLAARHAWYTNWINELREARDNDPRLQRAQEEIDRIVAKSRTGEAGLTNRQLDQIADIRGGMQDFVSTDTPDMFHVKQEMLANYQRMAPLQYDVQAAYRAATERMANEAEARGQQAPVETAPVPPPEPEAVHPVQENESAPGAQKPVTDVETPFVPTAQNLPAETGHIQTTADIAADVSRQLQAAGRPKEEADAWGQVMASHYESRARRLGGYAGTGAELYRAEGPVIQGAARQAAPGQRTLAQRAVGKAMDIAKQVPGLRQIMPDLTPEERGSLTKRLGANLVKVFAKLPFSAEEMASVAYSGRAKRGWYRDAAQAIHQLFGPADADRFTALLAAQSPRTSVESNLYNSLRTWVNWDKEGRPTDHATIKRIIGQSAEGTGGEASILDAWVNNSIRALTHPDPAKLDISGPKVSSFMKNLRGNVDEVTNDGWIATYAALNPNKFFKGTEIEGSPHAMGMGFYGKSTGYRAASAMVRRAAKILTERTGDTWTPAEMQETVWSWTKALYERRDRAGEDRTTQQILKAGDLTHEDVAGASDFASLLVRGIYSKILEEGGYGEELEGIRQSADERAAANRPTGPAVSVTSAEGSGIAQPAFERHLQSAAKRIEGVRTERIAESYNPTRDMAKKAAKSEIAANLSATTPSIPGIQQLADAANKGDVSAGHLVNLIAHDSLTRLMSGIPGVELETTSNGGLYGGTLEPSLGVNVKFHEKQRGPVLAALAKFAENFNQEQVHVRQPTIDEMGRVSTDGSYATPVYRIHLKTPLTREEIQHHIDTSGLYGLTFNDKMVEAYHVAIDPRSNKELEAFLANVEKLKTSLGENGGRFQQKVERLWAYGRGDGATAGYDAIAGELPPGKEQHTQVPRALAERELGHEVTPAEQAAEITPEQRALQERIAGHYEDLPENDLENPLVARAYAAATKAVDRQLQTVPIKYEAWADRQPDGSWVARGGEPYRNSNAMRADVLHNNHMWFFITDKDQFGPPGQAFTGHPLLENSGFKSANGYPMLQNDVLRVVHDYYAHLTSPVSFGPKGEEAAWRNHMATIDDPWARWALTSETRGQNSWVNFRPGVDEAMPLGERGFAPQKAALLPIEDTLSGDDYVDLPMLELQRELTPAQAQGSLKEDTYFQGPQRGVWWHGSASGDYRGGTYGLHLGTKAAAKQALEARIGIPAKGEWDGTREYGSTLLAGQKTLLKKDPHGYLLTGHNVRAPQEDYYATEHPEQINYANGESMPMSVKPDIRPFKITGPMTNTPESPHEDFKANGYMRAALKKGNARNGYFYRNVGEDEGSISAVVPSGAHLTPAEIDTLQQPNRGSVTFRKGLAPIIRMMADSDPSTIVHESGHVFLEEMMRDATHPQAPPQLLTDAATTRAWLGVKEGEAIPRAAHEKWARGFERYLMEGIAPNKELATVFTRFKQWLVKLYQSVNKLRSPINDDIRQVFDRLVATPDQPTIIAEPRNTSRMMADMHEVETTTTPPHLAGMAADQIDHEVTTQLRRTAPEEHDALLRSELESGAVQKPNAAPAGRVHEAKPLAGPTSGNAAAGPLAAGEHELAPASSQLRAAAVKTGAGAGPAAGEPRAAAESVEARIARRLGGGAERPGLGASRERGLEVQGTGPQVPSQLAVNVQGRAIAAGMPDEVLGDVMMHARLSKAEQSNMAAQLLAENPVLARAIAMGERPAPEGLMAIYVYRAVEDQARINHDWATTYDLTAKSKVLNSATDAGRILNALNDQDPVSPAAAMKAVTKAREAQGTTLAQKGMPVQLTPVEQQRIMDVTARAKAAQDDWVAHGMDYNDTARRRAAARAQMEVVQTTESMKPGQPFWSWNTLWNVAAIPKSLLTNFPHLSAPMVQGWGMITTDRGFFGIGQMLKYMASEENYLNNHADIISHPDYWMVDDGGLALTKLGDELSKREEAIQSSLVEQANQWLTDHTGLPNFTHIASRAFTGYLNFVRANRFYDLVAAARARGEDLSAGSRVIKDLAKVVNDFTGRGALGVGDKYGNTSQALNTVFFAPRKISATINMFNPERYLNPHISPTARIAATRQMFGSLAATSAVIGLAASMGFGVDLDPTSNDFAKIMIGDEKFDITGGNATYLKMMYRLITGWKKNAAGNLVDLASGKPFQETRADLLISYFRNKLAPTAGAFADALYGKDLAGRPFNLSDEMMEKLVPITIGDVINFAAYDHDNYAALFPMVSILFGVQMESPQAPKDMMGSNVWGQPTSHYAQPLREPIDQELKQIGYTMGFPQPAIQGVKLTDDQYKAYIQIAGTMAKENIENDMSVSGWADYPKEEKLRLIRSDVAAARRDAADQLMSEDLSKAPPGESIMDQATKISNRKNGIDQ